MSKILNEMNIIAMKQEVYELLVDHNEEEVKIVCENDDYDIAKGNCFVGCDDENGWISSMIGNILYSDAKKIIDDVFDLIKRDNDVPLEIDL